MYFFLNLAIFMGDCVSNGRFFLLSERLGVRDMLWLFFVFVIGIINTSSSSVNNSKIAMLELFLFVSIFLLWRSSFLVLRSYRLVALLLSAVVGFVVLANSFAVYEGVEPADWWRVIEQVAHLALFVAAFVVFVESPGLISRIFWGVGISVVVIFLFIAQAWLGAEDPRHYPWVSTPPLFTHIRNLGGFFCAASVLLVAAFFYFSGVKKIFFLGFFCLALAILFWSGGRGAIAACSVGALLLLLRFPIVIFWRNWFCLILAVLLALAFSAIFDVGNRSMGWVNMFDRTLGAESLDQVSSSRIYIWKSVLGFVAERPWFGWGGEAFRALRHTVSLVQPHNSVLQLLLEWGAVATCLVIGLCFWLFIRGGLLYLRHKTDVDFLVVLGFSLVGALFLLSLVDGVFYHGTSMAFFVVGCAALGAGIHRTICSQQTG